MEDTEIVAVKEDLRQSIEYGLYMEKIGWKVEKLGTGMQLFVRKVGPVAIAKMQRVTWPVDMLNLEKMLRKYRVMMCKLEPTINADDPKLAGFKQDDWPLLATKTLRVSLVGSEEKVRSGFRKDARYCLRRAEELAKKIVKNDFEQFYKIWKRAARVKDLWIPGEKEYQSLVEVFGNKVGCVTIDEVGGCLVVVSDGVAYYYYSGSLPEAKGRDYPYLTVWESMKDAKKKGATVWDFEGIFDKRWPNKGWRGFSHFKKSFGGWEINFPGCYTKWRLGESVLDCFKHHNDK
jgi:hypothetical protein